MTGEIQRSSLRTSFFSLAGSIHRFWAAISSLPTVLPGAWSSALVPSSKVAAMAGLKSLMAELG